MHEQLKQLIEELSVRDDNRIKYSEAQIKLQALMKDKQAIELAFKQSSEVVNP
jgi:hypothetical protein